MAGPVKDGIDGLHIDRQAYLDRDTLLLKRTPNSVEKAIFDDAAQTLTVAKTTDVEPVLELNKAYQNSGADGYSATRNMRYVAEIDMSIIELWNSELTARGVPNPNILAAEHAALLKAKLNDPDNRFLRTGGGTL